MSEPMSAKELEKSKGKARKAACEKDPVAGMLFCRIDAPRLFSEVERLTTENAMLRELKDGAANVIDRMVEVDKAVCKKLWDENATLRAELEEAIATRKAKPFPRMIALGHTPIRTRICAKCGDRISGPAGMLVYAPSKRVLMCAKCAPPAPNPGEMGAPFDEPRGGGEG